MSIPSRLSPSIPPITSTAASSTQTKSSSNLWSPPTQGEYAVRKDGYHSDVVNLYLHGSLAQVQAALQKAGWVQADTMAEFKTAKFVGAAAGDSFVGGAVGLWDKLTGEKTQNPLYPIVNSEPMSPLYYNGNPPVLEMQKNNNPLGGRDHLRIFNTGKVDAQGRPVWAVAASRDAGVKYDKYSTIQRLYLNHYVDPDSDNERNTVMQDLQRVGAVASAQAINLTYPTGPATTYSKDGVAENVVLN